MILYFLQLSYLFFPSHYYCLHFTNSTIASPSQYLISLILYFLQLSYLFFSSHYSCFHFINITIASPSPAPRSTFRDCRGCHDVSSCATSTRSESLRWHFHSLRIRCYDRRITGDPPSQCGTRLAPAENLSFPQENAGKVPFTEGKLSLKLTRNYFARIMFS